MNKKLLKSKRILKYKTQEEFAKALSISHKSYNQKALGKMPFKSDEILKIAKLLDLTKEDINKIFFDGKLQD
ncbi:MAG: DUF739 family protein [Clostridium sp.]|uniref:DUF739 family protein n=1 Tax=Clostridium sp. DSM 8431 TaxID=1761781 RepID=UPI0008F24805|nr:DUF739 family protein [Clostridium sp. DSM 8431]MCR4944658.1 DUF739 family protein [Clostridium sp.]SFU45111.1 Protein of unknown function [Clostridium sp. DSM 8431]